MNIRAALAVFAAIAFPVPPASAQHAAHRALEGRVAAGVTIARVQPAASELSGRTRIRPSLRRLPAHGFGVALAFNWFDAEIDESFAATDVPFGRLAIRPVMVGMAYTAVHGRLAISPSLVAGPALATLDVDESLEDRFGVAGNGFERNVGRISVATRAGVNATYAVAPRVALSAFGGYLWSRPSFMLTTPSGVVQRSVRADAVVMDAGVVVSLF
jgi:hypothetical protein